MNNPSLAEKIKYHRKSKGFSQEELSNKATVTVRTIQRIEKGEVNPHLNTIKLLAVALNVEVNELLPLENPKEETIQKQWLLLLHATPILGLFLPPCNVLIPLFLWIHKREDHPIYQAHGAKVLNFQITVLLLAIFSFISLVTIEKWGFFIFILTVPICIIIMIINIIRVVQTNKSYYPFAIPFIKVKKAVASGSAALLFLVLSISSCTSPKAQQVERLDGSKIAQDSITQKIEFLAKDAQVHGLAVAIFNNKQPVYQHITGYKNYPEKLVLTDSTSIYGASLSKAVFSILVMKLVEDKIIDLDTPLESYLPQKIHEYTPLTRWHDHYDDLKEDSLYHKITARMCLAHTTGFANWRFFEKDRKLRVNNEPGMKYGYSGEGFVYLQVVLEKITGKGLEELAQEIIFKPLQMNQSSYQWQSTFEKDFAYGHQKDGKIYEKDTDNEPRAGSTLETTPADYIKFLTAVLNQQLLTKASYEEIFRSQIRIHSRRHFGPYSTQTTDKYDNINLSCGLGWLSFETPYGKGISKGGHGDGFQHYSVIFPETGKGILIMTNSDNGEGIYKELLNYALADYYTPWKWSNHFPYK